MIYYPCGVYTCIVLVSATCLSACICCDCDAESVEVNDKIFSNANENGAADGFLLNLHSIIDTIVVSIEHNVFSSLKEKFNENCLSMGIGASVNEKRLCIANEALIVNTLLLTIKRAYDNYIGYIQEDQKEVFRNVFVRFLEVVEKMIMNTLANYISKHYNTILSVDLNNNNPFKISNVNISSFLNISNSIKLRNAVGQLFTLVFGDIALRKMNALNNRVGLTQNDIVSFDCMTLTFIINH